MDEEVSLDSTDEAERLVGWGCKVILMNFQRGICLKVNSLKRGQDKERLSLKEGSSFHPLRQENNSTSQLQKTRDQLGSNWGAIGE